MFLDYEIDYGSLSLVFHIDIPNNKYECRSYKQNNDSSDLKNNKTKLN